MIPFEEDNVAAYRLLLRIEIALRECLKLSFEQQFGPKWQNSIPGNLLTKIREAQREENRPQFDFLRLGPLMRSPGFARKLGGGMQSPEQHGNGTKSKSWTNGLEDRGRP